MKALRQDLRTALIYRRVRTPCSGDFLSVQDMGFVISAFDNGLKLKEISSSGQTSTNQQTAKTKFINSVSKIKLCIIINRPILTQTPWRDYFQSDYAWYVDSTTTATPIKVVVLMLRWCWWWSRWNSNRNNIMKTSWKENCINRTFEKWWWWWWWRWWRWWWWWKILS